MEEASQTFAGKTRITVTEAAALAAVNRTYFYEKFVKPWLIEVHQDERGKKYVELVELLRVTGPLKKKPTDNTSDNATQQTQTIELTQQQTNSDKQTDRESTQILQIKLEALRGMLHAKEEMLRVKDEQLLQAQERELFYQDELKAVRLLAAPVAKRKKWFFNII